MKGGRYVKKPDGSVERVEYTAPSLPAFGGETSSSPGGPAAHPLDHDGDGQPGGQLPFTERDLDDLKAEATRLGLRIDRRWGEERLRQEIQASKSGGAKEN